MYTDETEDNRSETELKEAYEIVKAAHYKALVKVQERQASERVVSQKALAQKQVIEKATQGSSDDLLAAQLRERTAVAKALATKHRSERDGLQAVHKAEAAMMRSKIRKARNLFLRNETAKLGAALSELDRQERLALAEAAYRKCDIEADEIAKRKQWEQDEMDARIKARD